MQKWIFENYQSAGDVLMLTAAIRDLHRAAPNKYITDVASSCPDLWRHNPHLTRLNRLDPDVKILECHYPLIHRSNQEPVHFLHGFMEFMSDELDIRIRPTQFKGDIHLSQEERSAPSPIAQKTGVDAPFWIIVAGGKYDFTIKWWHFRRFQKVVDAFRDKILFVQVGNTGDYHPALDGVLDFRGKTTLRELIHLVYHAQGVLCPVTMMMHLAAAVETKPSMPPNRACVVVAGGREAPHWEAYPHHQFIHTVGALPCCAEGGCWCSRIVALGDGHLHDEPERLCQDVVNGLPRCMDMITPEDVARRVEIYHSEKQLPFLTRKQSHWLQSFLYQKTNSLLRRGTAN